jgi:mannosyltransferase OCH1-like enzyme
MIDVKGLETLGRLSRAAAVLTWNRLRGRKSASAPQPIFRTYGEHTPFNRAIPKIIWMYWDDERLPVLIGKCHEIATRSNPDFIVNLLHPGNIWQFIPDMPDGLQRLAVQKQADWFRLYLLRAHGGIWMDASIILLRGLEWVLHIQKEHFIMDILFRVGKPFTESFCLSLPPMTCHVLSSYAAWIERILSNIFRPESISGAA